MTIPTPQEVHNLIARLRRNPEFIGNIEEAAAALSAYQDEVATLRERVRWFESSGGVAVHTRVFQEIARAEAAEARVRELGDENQRLIMHLRELAEKPQSVRQAEQTARQSAFAEAAQSVTRVEVVDDAGRAYTGWNVRVALSYQDDGRTLKVFVNRPDLATPPIPTEEP
jgi:conjugal transfer/entry exclusion protein